MAEPQSLNDPGATREKPRFTVGIILLCVAIGAAGIGSSIIAWRMQKSAEEERAKDAAKEAAAKEVAAKEAAAKEVAAKEAAAKAAPKEEVKEAAVQREEPSEDGAPAKGKKKGKGKKRRK